MVDDKITSSAYRYVVFVEMFLLVVFLTVFPRLLRSITGVILLRRKSWHKLLESDKYDLDNEPRYNSKFKQHMNYRDLYELTLNVSEELKLAYELKATIRNSGNSWEFQTDIRITTDSELVLSTV